jgi:hypothetical protein
MQVAWCSGPDFRGPSCPFNQGYLSRSYDDTLVTALREVGAPGAAVMRSRLIDWLYPLRPRSGSLGARSTESTAA